MNNIKTPLFIEQKVINLYSKNFSMNKISAQLSVSRPTIRRILVDNKIPFKSQPATSSRLLYSCNENYFSQINTGNTAYWLGFILADGAIQAPGGDPRTLTIKLATQDTEHLVLFKNALCSNHPIQHRKNFSYISISRIKLVNDLVSYGIVPNKTKLFQWKKDIVSIDLMPHFIRGLSDGDGCFYSGNIPRWSIANNFSVTKGCAKFLANKLNFKQSNICQRSPNGYEYKIGGNQQLKRLINYLYPNEDVCCLLRKKMKAQEIFFR